MKIFLYITALSIIILVASACKKSDNSPIYSGTIKKQTNSCSSSNGYAFIIMIDNSTTYDSIYTNSLPHEFWIAGVGKKINLRIRDYQSGENDAFCNASVIGAKFYYIYDVSYQN